MNLINAAEVIRLTGMRKNTDKGFVSKHLINAVQHERIRPVIGKEMHDELINEFEARVFTGRNEELIEKYIQPALAFYVHAAVLPQMHIQTTNSGLAINNTEWSSAPSSAQRAELQESILRAADSLLEKMVQFIEDNQTDFPKYELSETNVRKSTKIKGGRIFDK